MLPGCSHPLFSVLSVVLSKGGATPANYRFLFTRLFFFDDRPDSQSPVEGRRSSPLTKKDAPTAYGRGIKTQLVVEPYFGSG